MCVLLEFAEFERAQMTLRTEPEYSRSGAETQHREERGCGKVWNNSHSDTATQRQKEKLFALSPCRRVAVRNTLGPVLKLAEFDSREHIAEQPEILSRRRGAEKKRSTYPTFRRAAVPLREIIS
jgi:hypothetical protein